MLSIRTRGFRVTRSTKFIFPEEIRKGVSHPRVPARATCCPPLNCRPPRNPVIPATFQKTIYQEREAGYTRPRYIQEKKGRALIQYTGELITVEIDVVQRGGESKCRNKQPASCPEKKHPLVEIYRFSLRVGCWGISRLARLFCGR